nr:FimV/HubP family polar landmark protein [Pseudomonas luteola]
MATKNVNRFRTLIIVSGLVLGVGSNSVFAVGLGNIALQSSLYQPLSARIELVDVGELEASDFHIGLASNDEFARSGLDRTQFMSDMHFTPVIEPGGRSYIRVTSTRPVSEPYLSFLVGLELPGGRQLREFTVLIDPPGYQVPASPAVSRSNSYAQVEVSRPAVPRASRPSMPPAPTPRPDLQAGAATYTTRANDTLWQIAQKLVRQAGKGSVRQMMEDLYSLNINAFAAGDMHRLRVGHTLRLPADFSAPVAAAEQNAASIVAPAQNPPREQPVPSESPTNTAPVQAGVEQAPTAFAQQDQLLLRMAQLQTQLEQLQARLDETVRDKDNQIAALQQEVTQLRTFEKASDIPPPADPSLAPSPSTLSDSDTGVTRAPSEDPSQAPTIAPSAPTTLPEQSASQTLSPLVAPLPVQVDAEQEKDWSSYYLWLVPVAALLAAVLIAIRRRRMQEESTAAVVADLPEEGEPDHDGHALVPLVEPAVIASRAEPHDAEPLIPISPQHATPKADDEFLGRAEIYLAYGRYNQAREVLEEGIAEQPGRLDLRMMLLQVLAALGERKLFAVQEAAVRELGGDTQAIDQLKALLPGMIEESAEGQSVKAEEEPLEVSLDLPDDQEEEWKPQLDLKADEMKPTQADIENFDLDLQDLSFDDAIALTELLDAEQGHEKAKPAEALDDDFPYTLGELPSVDELDMTLDEHFASHVPSVSVADNELSDYPASPLLQQAKSCMAQGDMRAASAILQRILNEGNDAQRHEAEVLLARIA